MNASDTTILRRLEQVEERLTLLEDERQIRCLLARYGFLADQGRHAEWVRLFREDGSISYPMSKAALDGSGTGEVGPGSFTPEEEVFPVHVGHEQIRKLIDNPRGHMLIEGKAMHIAGANLHTRIEEACATAECYNLTIVRNGAQFAIVSGSVGVWKLEKTDGTWQIRDCVRRLPGSTGFADILETRA